MFNPSPLPKFRGVATPVWRPCTHTHTHLRAHGRTHERTDGHTDGRADELTNGRGHRHTQTDSIPLKGRVHIIQQMFNEYMALFIVPKNLLLITL